MRVSLLLATAATPLLSLGIWSSLPSFADNTRFNLAELPPLPELNVASQESVETFEQKLWFQVREETALKTYAGYFSLGSKALAELNGTDIDHVFPAGSWLSVPRGLRRVAVTLSSLDQSTERTYAPMPAPPPVSEVAKVQRGDSLSSFLSTHGITKTQLKSFNPGVQLNALTVGRELRIAKAASGQALLAIRPTTSGGASWPDTPGILPAEQPTTPPPSRGYLWPTKGVFTSGFGWRWGRMHKGIDIANNTGTPIVAARDGVVSHSGWSGAYGYLVEIAHSDGESTRYAHNSRLLVKKGQIIPRGARIALMGSTGRSTGPHLHFEIRKPGGAAQNPLSKLPPRKA